MAAYVKKVNKYNGLLSDKSIEKAIAEGDIFIAPFDRKQLQPAGYNLTPTCFVYSTKRKCLLNVIKNDDETYVMIDRNDTVLIKTRESIAISSVLAGNFFSKVKIVSEGFGHVSTTLDPGWEGKLLISINNPTNKKMKFSIEKKVYGTIIHNSFVTVEFIGLDSETENKSDNPPGRLDILEGTVEKNLSVLKKEKIENLKELIDELNDYENITLNDIVMQMLNENEFQELAAIKQISDNVEYEREWSRFIGEKERKYYRDVQKVFAENARQSTDLVEKYVTEKLRYQSVRKKIVIFIWEHLSAIFGIACAIAIVVALYMLKTGNESVKDGQGTVNFRAIEALLSMVVMYIVFPLLRDLLKK